MSSTKHKLRLVGAFAALAMLALAVSCTGFFQNPTVSSITIDPPNPTVAFGPNAATQQMTAAATYSDGSTGTLTGGSSCTGSTVCWSSSDPTVASISTGGLLTGLSAGTTTITAASGSITATTSATAAEVVTSMTITPITAGITANGTQAANFTITGTTQSGTQDISALVTLTPDSTLGTPADDNVVSCIATTVGGESVQQCTAAEGLITTDTTYYMVVSYSGYTGTALVYATLNVTP
ncbi:MAG: Ig-like domain-containing protein [Candidatus Sulfotelmatobacter sp.]